MKCIKSCIDELHLITFAHDPINVSIASEIKYPLMVCSHERSGTHFLMNSLSSSTFYTNEPYLDYDSLGSAINFFSKKSIFSFIHKCSDISTNNGLFCVNSIIKSHFPLPLIGDDSINILKIVYIYRNPVDVFISFWKFLHRWKWFEGPKLDSPLELMRSRPCGQSQRYQIENYHTYFSRWANHVSSAYIASKKIKNITCINYSDLLFDYANSIEDLCDQLSVQIIEEPKMPNKSNYIKGVGSLEVSEDVRNEMNEYCGNEVRKYKFLPLDIIRDFS